MKILPAGFEDLVRSRLGVDEEDLNNFDVNNPFVSDLAEEIVIKRVPEYASITDSSDLLFLKQAVVSYMCYLLCKTLPLRLNKEVQTIDVKWKKYNIKWDELEARFLDDFETSLLNIESVPVELGYDSTLIAIASTERSPIGGGG